MNSWKDADAFPAVHFAFGDSRIKCFAQSFLSYGAHAGHRMPYYLITPLYSRMLIEPLYRIRACQNRLFIPLHIIALRPRSSACLPDSAPEGRVYKGVVDIYRILVNLREGYLGEQFIVFSE